MANPKIESQLLLRHLAQITQSRWIRTGDPSAHPWEQLPESAKQQIISIVSAIANQGGETNDFEKCAAGVIADFWTAKAEQDADEKTREAARLEQAKYEKEARQAAAKEEFPVSPALLTTLDAPDTAPLVPVLKIGGGTVPTFDPSPEEVAANELKEGPETSEQLSAAIAEHLEILN
jgi:hypothetical protein